MNNNYTWLMMNAVAIVTTRLEKIHQAGILIMGSDWGRPETPLTTRCYDTEGPRNPSDITLLWYWGPPEIPLTSRRYDTEGFKEGLHFVSHHAERSQPLGQHWKFFSSLESRNKLQSRLQLFRRPSEKLTPLGMMCTEKTLFPIPFIVNGIWSWWQFLKQMEIAFGSKTVTTIISHSLWKEMET